MKATGAPAASENRHGARSCTRSVFLQLQKSTYRALSPSFINNVSIKAFKKTVVDICREICLSLWPMAKSLSLFLARSDACASALDPTKKPGVETSTGLPPGRLNNDLR